MNPLTTPAIRRALYFVVAAALAVLVAVGIITETQYDTWTGVIEDLTPLLGTIALTVAGAKTHRGSDDRATTEDVRKALEDNHPTPMTEEGHHQDHPPVTEQPAVVQIETDQDALSAAQDAYQQATSRN